MDSRPSHSLTLDFEAFRLNSPNNNVVQGNRGSMGAGGKGGVDDGRFVEKPKLNKAPDYPGPLRSVSEELEFWRFERLAGVTQV